MRKPKKKILAGLVSLGVMMTSLPSQAIIPVTDYAIIGQKILENYQSMQQHMEKVLIFKAKMDQIGMFTSAKIEATNNSFGNMVARTGRQLQDIQNIEALQSSSPGHNACETISISLSLKDTLCFKSEEVNESKKKIDDVISGKSEKLSKFDHLGNSDDRSRAENLSLYQSDIALRATSEVQSGGQSRSVGYASDGSIEHDGEPGTYISNDVPLVLQPSLLISGNPYKTTLSEDERQAMEDLILLIAPPFAPTTREQALLDDGTSNLTSSLLEKQARLSVPHDVLMSALARRTAQPGIGISELGALQKMSDEYYGVGDDYQNSVSYKIQTDKTAMPATNWRNKAAMMASNIHLSIEEIKINTNMEKLLAVKLSNKLNELGM